MPTQAISSRRRKPKAESPALLPDILPFPIGQPIAKSLLSAALAKERWASAYLFTGPTGIGKAMAARWLAAQILWQTRRADAASTQQMFLNQIEIGSYPDLIWVEPTYWMNGIAKPRSEVLHKDMAALTPQIRMEQAVALRRTLQEVAIGSRWVVVIEAVDKLTNEAGNALLKLLEDRTNCTFILTTACLDRVMPTIRSRAQTVPFVSLPLEACRAVVEQHCPELLKSDELLKWGSGAPGQVIAAYQKFCEIPSELSSQLAQFTPTSPAEGVLRGLRLAKGLSALPVAVQKELLWYLQYCLAQQDRQAIALIEQMLNLLDQRVQSQAVWELLFCHCAMRGLKWRMQLPISEVDQRVQCSADAFPHSVKSSVQEAIVEQVSLF